MDTNISELTRGEEEIMQILWRLGDAVVNDIIARTDEPHPKYTTVATFLKILELRQPQGRGQEPPLLSADRPRGVCTGRHVVDAFQLFRRFAGPTGIVLLAP